MPSNHYHRKLILLVCLFISGFTLFAQPYQQLRNYDSAYYALRLDSLEKLVGKNTEDLPGYALPVLLALSHYPELSEAHIRFKNSKISTTMNCRPTTGSLLFRSRIQRRYVIRINNDTDENAIHYIEVPFNAAVGLSGHEIAHILDYSRKGFFGILGRGFTYMGATSKARFEKEIDMVTLSRGLGWQLYDWTCYVQFKSNATERYKAYKRTTYLGPGELEELLFEEK